MSFQGRACWGARRGDDERAFPSHYSIQQEALGGLALLSIISTRGGGGGGEARTSAGAEGFNKRCLKKHENVSVKLLSLCRGSADLHCFPLSAAGERLLTLPRIHCSKSIFVVVTIVYISKYDFQTG